MIPRAQDRLAPTCRAALAGGRLRLDVPGGGPPTSGASTGLFMGDVAVDTSTLTADADGNLHAWFDLTEVPRVEQGGLEFRFLLLEQNLELTPALCFRDTGELLAACGALPMHAVLTRFDGRAIAFDLDPGGLPRLPRRLSLMIDGTIIGSASSRPPKPVDHAAAAERGPHLLEFGMSGILRDGALIELLDDATGNLVFSQTMTWLSIAGALLSAHQALADGQAALARDFTRLRAKSGAIPDAGRENLMLERLDLYHAMLMDRLDREFRAIRHELGLNEPAAPVAACGARVITPAELEGVGLYHVEIEDGRQWRWFGAETTFILRGAGAGSRLLRLHYTPAAPELDFGAMHCTVNFLPARITATGTLLEIVLSSAMARPDDSLIVHLRFSNAYTPPNDGRALTLACSRLELLSA